MTVRFEPPGKTGSGRLGIESGLVWRGAGPDPIFRDDPGIFATDVYPGLFK